MREIILVLCVPWLLLCVADEKQDESDEAQSPVVARANDSVLTIRDLELMVPQDYKEYYGLEDRKALINRWVETELIYQEAVKRGIDQEPEIKLKVDEFRRLLLENEILQRELGSRVRITEDEVEKYYKDKPDLFLREKEEVRLSQIVVDSSDKADSLRLILERDPNLFATFAEEHSLDKSGENGGDVGYYAVDELIEPLRIAVQALKVGEISSVVSVPGYGYFIIQVTDRQGHGTMKALEDVEDEIKDILLVGKEEKERNKWMQDLIARNSVDINWQLLEEYYGD